MSTVEQAWCRSAPWRCFTRELVLPWALQGQRLSGDVLEIGGGGGAMAAGILERFPDVRLTVTDYDPAMVDAASEHLAGCRDRVRVRRADATALAFGDDSFDAVVSFIMLHHVISWEQAIAEMVRVLRPGGVLLGYDLLAHPLSRLIHVVDRSRNRLMTLPELRVVAEGSGCSVVLEPALGRLALRFRFRTRDDPGGRSPTPPRRAAAPAGR